MRIVLIVGMLIACPPYSTSPRKVPCHAPQVERQGSEQIITRSSSDYFCKASHPVNSVDATSLNGPKAPPCNLTQLRTCTLAPVSLCCMEHTGRTKEHQVGSITRRNHSLKSKSLQCYSLQCRLFCLSVCLAGCNGCLSVTAFASLLNPSQH